MRVVVVVGGLGAALEPPEVGAAITTGWRAAAPADELVVFPTADDGLGVALDGAELALVVAAAFDWQSLRSSPITAVAGAAVERGVPCVVLAGQVSVGRREAAAVGVDAAYAVADSAPSVDAQAVSAEALSALAERVAHRWSR
jgi:glycerate kinase